MSGVSSVSGGSSTSDLMQVLENSMQETVDLANKFIEMAAENKVDAAEATGVGQALDLYA